jgi:putative Holliday junction resolvase
MACWMSIDHGHKRIGIAVGDSRDGIASPLTVLDVQGDERDVSRIIGLAGDYHASALVVGLPINMDDTLGPQAREATEFARLLARHSSLDVRMWDERLSSFEADQDLAGHWTRKKRKARQDAVAAANVLRDFFRSDGPNKARRPEDVSLD